MDKISETIHQPTRLKIMAALKSMDVGESIDFVRLRTLVNTTDGNLGAHVNTLAAVGLLDVDKGYEGKRPCTRVALSPLGYAEFERYISELKAILAGSDGQLSMPEIARKSTVISATS